jgi:hypothetical protein
MPGTCVIAPSSPCAMTRSLLRFVKFELAKLETSQRLDHPLMT